MHDECTSDAYELKTRPFLQVAAVSHLPLHRVWMCKVLNTCACTNISRNFQLIGLKFLEKSPLAKSKKTRFFLSRSTAAFLNAGTISSILRVFSNKIFPVMQLSQRNC